MRSQDISPTLLHDANLMIDTLMEELRELNRFDLITTRDNRMMTRPESIAEISHEKQAWAAWYQCMQDADMTWFVAPETDGILLKVRELADKAGCRFIGCDPEAIRVTSSKKHCTDYFTGVGLRCIPTEFINDHLPESHSGWIIKPDDGAGSEETFIFTERSQIETWKRQYPELQRFVVQPYVEGIAASMSVVYRHGQCQLLACNIQHMRFIDGVAKHEGITVNGLLEKKAELLILAEQIGQALPGLEGYVGTDVICTETGPVLVEINPRLTTSYAGLRKSLEINVAEFILKDMGILEPEAEAKIQTKAMHCLPVSLAYQ